MAIELHKVEKEVRLGFWMKRLPILKGISGSFELGQTWGILGPNGAGKTSLIHLLVGIKRPTKGCILIDGKNAHLPAARIALGYLPERPYFYDHLTGYQFLRLMGRLAFMEEASLPLKVESALASVGMTHAAGLELRKYSKGMLQRIGIAQAVIHQPRYLILDEPMSGLDPVGRKEMRGLIASLRSPERLVLFSSHLIQDIEDLCDQALILKKGSVLQMGNLEKIRGSVSSLEEFF